MTNDWRVDLKDKVREIQKRGGPHKSGELIVIPVDLSESEFGIFETFTGWLNDYPLGDARAGTLEIRPLVHGKQGLPRLAFLLHPKPPASFGISQSPTVEPAPRRMMPGVEFDSIRAGVDFETLPWFVFPTDRSELSAMKSGSRYDALVPVSPIAPGELDAGSRVMFYEATSDPFGNPYSVPGGETLGLTLTKVREDEIGWGGKKLVYIRWDSDVVKRQFSQQPLAVTPGKRPGKIDA